MKIRNILSSLFTGIVGWLLFASASVWAQSGDFWWDASWNYRSQILVESGPYLRADKPVDIGVDFSQILTNIGDTGEFDPATIRVVEVDTSGTSVIDADVSFQFDPAEDFDSALNAAGRLIFLANGITADNTSRNYHVYFNLAGSGISEAIVPNQVSVTDNVVDEGQTAVQIDTPAATYYYHKAGAGFSSLIDTDGNDWVDHHPTGGSAGAFRGIPNLAFPEGHFHPGATTASTTILSQGPLKATIESTTTDGLWKGKWEFYPGHARFTVMATDHNYWFLYEGTPGGLLEEDSDFVMRSDGTSSLLSSTWALDLDGDEWVYFADPNVGKSLFLANHTSDTAIDSYRPQGGLMTVFGFGRDEVDGLLSQVPAEFTVSLVESTDFAATSTAGLSAYKALTASIQSSDSLTPTAAGIAIQPGSTTVTEGQLAEFVVVGSGSQPLSYQWQEFDGTSFVDLVNETTSVLTLPGVSIGNDDGRQFRVAVSNSLGSAASESATITVTEIDPTPTAVDDSFRMIAGATLTVAVDGVLTNDISPVNSVLNVALPISDDVSHGQLTVAADGSFTYQPDQGFVGIDSFVYQAVDGTDLSNVATTRIRVQSDVSDPDALVMLPFNEGGGDTAYNSVNIAPDGQLVNGPLYTSDTNDNSSNSLRFDGNNDYIDLGAFDVDGSGLTLAAWFKADSFTGAFNDGRLISKASGVSGSDHIFMLSTVQSDASVKLRARVRVGGVIHTLVADSGILTTAQWYHATLTYDESELRLYLNGALVGSSNVSGPVDKDPAVSVSVAAQPPGAGGRYFDGSIDAVGIWQRALGALEIAELVSGEPTPNQPPEAVADSYVVTYDEQLDVVTIIGVLANDLDGNGDPLTAVLVDDVSTGNLGLNTNGSFSYTPVAGATGSVTFSYFASDGTVNSDIVTVTLTINPPFNNLPVAVEDSYSTTIDTSLTVSTELGVLSNDSDEDASDVLSAVLVSGMDVQNGDLILNTNGSFTYTPEEGFFGEDGFSYYATDGVADSDVVEVTLTVENPNTNPNQDILVNLTLDDNQTPLVAADISVNNNNGTISGATYEFDSGDGSVSSLKFDGSDNVNLGKLDAAGTGLTLAAWIRADSFPGPNRDPRIISKSRNVSRNSHTFMLSTVKRGSSSDTVLQGRVRVRGVTRTYRANTGQLSPGVWYHTAMVYDESSMKLYLDGVEIASTNIFGPLAQDSTSNVVVGANPSGGYNWDGNIDDVVIAQYPYSPTEILGLATGEPVVNQPPVALADNYSASPDGTLSVIAANGLLNNDSDGNGDTLSAVLIENVNAGNLELNSDGSFSYTPPIETTGTFTFRYAAFDGVDSSDAVTVAILVEPSANEVPIASPDFYNTTVDSVLSVNTTNGVLANDTDADSELMAILALGQNVSNGTLVLNDDGSFVYTPDSGYAGIDSFSYSATDGEADSEIVEVRITVANPSTNPALLVHLPLDDHPTPTVAADVSINGNNGVISSAVYDFESGDGSTSSLSFDGSGSVNLGALDVEGSGLTLAAWIKADSFPGVNRDPRIISKARNISTNSHVFMLSTKNRGSSSDTVLQGRVRVNGVTRTYRANTGALETGVWYHAAMVFDGSTMKLYLDGVEIASTDIYGSVDQDSVSNVFVGGNPSGGYGWNGNIDGVIIAEEPYTAEEIQALASGLIAPEAIADSYDVLPDEQFLVTLGSGVLANDLYPEQSLVQSILISDVSNGMLNLSPDGGFTYTPEAGFSGSDSFSYLATFGSNSSDPAIVKLNVFPPPNAVDDAFTLEEDATFSVLPKGVLQNDVDTNAPDDLTAELVSSPANGTLIEFLENGTFTYVPASNFHGSDSFTYKAIDGVTGSAQFATVTMTINSINDIPVGVADLLSTNSDTAQIINTENDLLANDSDVDGDALSVDSFTQPANGTLIDNIDGSLTYTPLTSFAGTDSFVYRLTDGLDVSDTVIVSIDVISDPDALFSLAVDEGTGNLAVNSVSSGSDGQLVGGPTYSSDVPDGGDHSLRFDGIDDYIDLGSFDPDGGGLTLALWFKAASFPGSQNDSRLISKATGVSGSDHIFMLSTIRSGTDIRLRARIRVAGVTETLIASTGNLSTDIWHHATMTYDENTLSLYLDGVLVGSSSVSGSIEQAPGVPVAVAAQPPGAGGRYFHGNLDAINIWQRALDGAEIVELTTGEPPAVEEPSIVTELVNANVSAGDAAQFTVSAVGAAPLSYEWQEQLDGEFITLEGETGTTLNLSAVQISSDNGRQFRVVIGNAIGQVISSIATLTVSVANDPPVASFIASPLSGVAPLNVSFDASASSDDQGIVEYEWNFGDGSSETIAADSTSHIFDDGSYTVELIVRDAQGETGIVSQVVVVEQAPSAPVIVIDPQDFSVVSGGGAQFGVLVIGTDPITYQWEEFDGAGFSPLPGEVGDTLVLSEVSYPSDNDRQFRVALTNTLGNTPSETATLTVTEASDRVTADLEALYLFNTGSGDTIKDVAGAEGVLDLTISDPTAVNWLSGGGIEVVNPTRISSTEPATEVSNAIARSGEISLETWIKPANLTQNGPARIVTLSDGALNRNFTLGQGVAGSEATRYDVRLRATSSSDNGTPSLSTATGSLTTELTHVVYTRDVCGISRTYLDGSLVASGILSGDLSNWDRAYRLALGEEFDSTTRPWLGSYHLVAFYSQALGAADVRQNFQAGIDGLAAPSIVQGTRPFAVLNATPTSGSTPLLVSFDAADSSAPNGSIAQYIWDFGNGETDSGMTVDHSYTSGGCERATVTVTDNIGVEDSAALRIDPVANGGGVDNGEARPLNWEVLSTSNGDLPALPGTHRQQTSALVFDINNDNVNDFVIGRRAQTNGQTTTGPLINWYERTADGWNIHTIENDESLYLEAGGEHYDIDGDGDQDLVIGSGQLQENNELWWWENPYPNFTPGVPWTRRVIKQGGGRQHHDQLFGDFDNDSKVELVYWVNRDYALMFAEIPADPTVEPWPATQIFTGNDFFPIPEGLAASDIDGDGVQDIVGAGYWFKHNGDGSFAPNLIDITQTYTRAAAGQLIAGGRPEVVFDSGDVVGPLSMYEWDEQNLDWTKTDLLGRDSRSGHSLNIADIDDDGHLDIFSAEMVLGIAARTEATMSILFGDSTGNFSLSELASGIANHESKVADLDGDGDLDVLRKPFIFQTPELEVWLNQGRNPFNNWQRKLADEAVPWRTIFVEHGDIDNDGLEDIISGGWWWKNPGQITGTWARNTIGAPLHQMATVYDFDNDGDLDVLGTESRGAGANADFRWAENDGSGSFTIHGNVESAVGGFLQGVTVAEFQPGVLQVALSWQAGEGGLQLLTVPPAGLEASATWVWNAPGVVVEGEGLDHGDIDNDGDLDILAGTTWLRNDGTGQWTLLTLHNAVDQEADRNILVDMDADGDLDALIGYGHDPLGTLAWYEQPFDPEELWIEHNIAFLGPSAVQSVDVSDVDGDGDLDVIAGEHQNPSVPGLRMLVFENKGSGIWNSHEVFAGDEHHDGGQLADFDGDGDLDIVSIGWLHRNLLIYENLQR